MTKIIRLIGIIVASLSIIPLGLAAYWYEKNDKFLGKAIKTEVTVVDVKERSTDDGTLYYPVFSFIDHNNKKREIHSSLGTYPPTYEIGDTTSIYYDPENPKSTKFDSFVSLWLGPTILLGVGMIPLFIGAFLILVGPMIIRAVSQKPQDVASLTQPAFQHTIDQNDKRARMWATLSHMTALSVFAGIPFGNILGPLVIWLMRRDVYPIVDVHGKESLNFQISMSLYGIISLFLCFVLLGFIMLPAILITNLVLVLVASLKADKGILYHYPLTLRLIK